MLIWALRCGYSRGFGVQSPWAYGFIRYVINEHYPYYAYETLARRHRRQSALSRKLGLLYFRMANHLRPQTVVDGGCPSGPFADYVNAGCRKSSVAAIGGKADFKAIRERLNAFDSVDMARLLPVDGVEHLYDALCDKATPASMFVVEGIHTSKAGRRMWRSILHDGRTGVTFDLYYCGIVCFDKKRYRQNYIVNF